MANRAIKNFIICEDIRVEVRGKITLVGVFSDTIEVNTPVPAVLMRPLCFVVYFDSSFVSDREVTLAISAPGKRNEIFSSTSAMKAGSSNTIVAVFTWKEPQFATEGEYTVRLRVDGKSVFRTPLFIRCGDI
jgi:hypothetical protein